jgi:hypothetical protein
LDPSNNVIHYYPIEENDTCGAYVFVFWGDIGNRNITLIKKSEIEKLLGKLER